MAYKNGAVKQGTQLRLNPYSNGITSLGVRANSVVCTTAEVLILILMELPHWEFCGVAWRRSRVVLILILMELPHWDREKRFYIYQRGSLNPYSNGITSLGNSNRAFSPL